MRSFNFIFTFIFTFIFISCGEKKKENITTKKTNIKIRKDVEISNLNYFSTFNGAKEEGESEEYFGAFVNDRFDSPKKALFLDGISDYGKIYNVKELNSGKHISISIWYKPDSYRGNGNNIILSKSNTTITQYALSSIGSLYPKTPGTFKLSFSIEGTLNTIKTKPDVWQPDNWYLLTGTYDGTKMNLYVNGKLLAGRKVVGTLDVYDFNLFIGKTPTKEYYTSGSFDDLKIFNKALSKKEIMSLYQNR